METAPFTDLCGLFFNPHLLNNGVIPGNGRIYTQKKTVREGRKNVSSLIFESVLAYNNVSKNAKWSSSWPDP